MNDLRPEDQARVRRALRFMDDEAPLAPELSELGSPSIETRQESLKANPFLIASGVFVVTLLVITPIAFLLRGGSDASPLGVPGPVTQTSTTNVTTVPLPALSPGEFPRVMIDLPEWTISYIEDSEGETENGHYHHSTIQFTDGSSGVELRLVSGVFVDLEALIADRLSSGTRRDDQAVLGSEAFVVRYDDGSSFTAMWSANGVEYEFVADTNEDVFQSLLGALTHVGEAEWIASLPDTVISDRPAAVRQYLADIPLPPALDPTALENGPMESSYQVGADTIGAVACGWIEHWINAKAAGDQASMQEAVDAMAGSREWDILIDMTAEGAFSDVVWTYADAIAADGTVPGGRVLTVEESYTNALCSSG